MSYAHGGFAMPEPHELPVRRVRQYADFTGADPRREDDDRYFSALELARSRAEEEENGRIDEAKATYHLSAPLAGTMPVEPKSEGILEAIGLSGFAQTGKTTVASYIESKYGYRRQHIAEPLRAMLRTLLQRFSMEDELIDRYLTGDLKEQVIPCLGITSRQAQITLGTEWGRELVSDDLWSSLWAFEAAQTGGGVMNDSVRFPNEETAIQKGLLGFTIMVKRPGTGPVAYIGWKWLSRKLYQLFGCYWGVHPSERADKLNPDYVIVNDGTLEDLYEKVDDIMEFQGVIACAL